MTARLLVLVLAVLCLTGIVSAQPAPIPLSPQDANLVRAYPALAAARDIGVGVVITGVDQFGCTDSALQIEYAVVVADPGQTYALNTRVRNSGLVYMNERATWSFPSGHYAKYVEGISTGGPIGGTFPMNSDTFVTIEMVVSEASTGRPLWYSKMEIFDCEGTPTTITGLVSKAVKVLNKNPTFQPNPANPAAAAKWTPSGKVKYSCAGSGVCTQKFTGKAGKLASITHSTKIKPALPDGTRIGLAISLDASAAINGTVRVAATLFEPGMGNDLTFSFELFKDGPIFTASDIVILHLGSTAGAGSVNKLNVELNFADTTLGGQAASGTVKVTDLYVFAITP